MDRVGPKWTEWTVMDQIGPKWINWTDMDRIGWSGPNLSGQNGPNRT